MKIDLQTLMIVQIFSGLVQAAVLFVQFRVNRSYRGQGWMVAGNGLLALGYLALVLPRIFGFATAGIVGGNLLFVFGMLFIYFGLARFPGSLANFLGAVFLLTALVFAIHVVGSFAHVFIDAGISAAGIPREIFLLALIVLGPVLTYSYIIKINQRLHADAAEARGRLELIFKTSPDAVIVTRLSDGCVVSANEAFASMTGYTRDEVIGRTLMELRIWKSDQDRRRFREQMEGFGRCENLEFIFGKKDGGSFVGLVSGRTFEYAGTQHILSVTHDISSRKEVETALRESETKFREMADLLPQIVFETDAQGRLTYVNRQAYPICGYAETDNLIGVSTIEFYAPEDRPRAIENIKKRVESLPMGNNEYRIVRKDGSTFPALVYSSPILREGKPGGLRGIIVDISDQKRAEEEISRLARQLELERNYAQASAAIDGLTRLSNRRRFDEVLRSDFFRLKRTNAFLSLIMLDVDFFKKYNDEYGHLAGDECLRMVGETLAKIVGRAHDTVARYGGEEFAVVMPETEGPGARIIADRIRAAVEELAIPHAASSVAPRVTVSLGVTTVATADMASPEMVIELADEALYAAKKTGRNRVVQSDAALTRDMRAPRTNLVKLIWSVNDESGDAMIDREHRSLFQHSNEIVEALLRGETKSLCMPRIESLLGEIFDHFRDEEALLRRVQYPDLPNHAERHAALLGRAGIIAARYLKDEVAIGEVFGFLVYEVIVQHLLSEDKKYFPYITSP